MKKLIIFWGVIFTFMAPVHAADKATTSGFTRSATTPQDFAGVSKDCANRIAMVSNQENVFNPPPKPNWGTSKWKKKKDILQKEKATYRDDTQSLNQYYKDQHTKLTTMAPTNKLYKSTLQELYSNCKRFTDGIAQKLSNVNLGKAYQ
jgi:hypothetical protein